ncbi:MAG TPA: SRPBCC domain-containing protein, partial [Myxococcota bacterium]
MTAIATNASNKPARAVVTRTGEREIRIERIFNAGRQRVWNAITDPALLAQWWGRGNKLTIEKLDFVRGGHWRFVEHTSPHGPQGFEGRFAEIAPIEKVARTFEWDGMPGHTSLETVNLVDLGDGRTKLVIETVFMSKADLDGMLSSGMEGGM